MNPNLKYGQGIPGGVEGRPMGLITARCLADLVDAIGLLAGSKSWTTNDQQGMIAWAGDYFQWLTTSKIGPARMLRPTIMELFTTCRPFHSRCSSQNGFRREKILAARETALQNKSSRTEKCRAN